MLATATLGFSQPSAGQAVKCDVLGTVNDPRSPVANAEVELTELTPDISRVSDQRQRKYVVPILPPGTYRVIAEL